MVVKVVMDDEKSRRDVPKYTVVKSGSDAIVEFSSAVDAAKAFHSAHVISMPAVIYSGVKIGSGGFVATSIFVEDTRCKSVGSSPLDKGEFHRQYLLLAQELESKVYAERSRREPGTVQNDAEESVLEKRLAEMTSQEMERAEWRSILQGLTMARDYLCKDGVRHTWLDGSIALASERSKGNGIYAPPGQLAIGRRESLVPLEISSDATLLMNVLADSNQLVNSADYAGGNGDKGWCDDTLRTAICDQEKAVLDVANLANKALLAIGILKGADCDVTSVADEEAGRVWIDGTALTGLSYVCGLGKYFGWAMGAEHFAAQSIVAPDGNEFLDSLDVPHLIGGHFATDQFVCSMPVKVSDDQVLYRICWRNSVGEADARRDDKAHVLVGKEKMRVIVDPGLSTESVASFVTNEAEAPSMRIG